LGKRIFGKEGRRFMTIKGKLLLILGTFCLIILAMTGITYVRGSSMLNELLDKSGTEIAVSSAQTLQREFDKLLAVTKLIAAPLEEVFAQPDMTRDAVEDETVRLGEITASDGVMGITVGYESDGDASQSSRRKPSAGYDARTRPWYKLIDAAPRGEIVITEPYLDLETNIPVISMGRGLYDRDGKRVGGLCVDMKLEPISEFVVNRQVFQQGTGFLLSPSGLVAALQDKNLMLKSNILDREFGESMNAMGRRMLKEETGFIDYVFQGESKRTFFAPVGYGFSLGIFFPVTVINTLVNGLTLVLLIAAVVAILLSGSLMALIIRGVSRSVRNMGAVTALLGSGDLTARFDENGHDELAHMAHSLNGMVASVSEALTEIQQESGGTAQQAENLAALSEETLASMEEVTASVERVNGEMQSASSAIEGTRTAISELSTAAAANATASTECAARGSEVSEGASHASAGVSEVVVGMKEARDRSEESKVHIDKLAQAIDSISGFVDTITSIADQTNMLALNAAIEAARAGDTGRGFAVVAEEVRKLAEESGSAAQEIAKQIKSLKSYSAETLDTTDQAVSILGNVVSRAEAAEASLRGSLSATQALNEAIHNIAAISEEQAASVSEMTHSVDSVAQANETIVSSTDAIHSSTQETSHAAESIATAAQAMAETAERLQGLVRRFKLSEGGGIAAPQSLPGRQALGM